MTRIIAGRMTHRHEGELVVFMIGMRISKPWRPDLWVPAFRAMPRMLQELFTDRESGLIGARFTVGAGGPVVIQYWSSLEKLYSYASDRNAEHRPAWAAFNKRARSAPGAVGIWHETYAVAGAESMYVGMPVSGLALATKAVEVGSHNSEARGRMRDGTPPVVN